MVTQEVPHAVSREKETWQIVNISQDWVSHIQKPGMEDLRNTLSVIKYMQWEYMYFLDTRNVWN